MLFKTNIIHSSFVFIYSIDAFYNRIFIQKILKNVKLQLYSKHIQYICGLSTKDY